MGIILQNRILNKDKHSIKGYLKELKKIPVLSKEEELHYASLAKSGDEKAKEKLILHNLKFVVSTAKQYTYDNILIEDLINEGNLGLMEAVNRFDPERGFKFISYAVWWIERYMKDYVALNRKSVEMPKRRALRLAKFKQIVSSLEQREERVLCLDDLLEIGVSDFPEVEIRDLYEISHMNVSSIDTPINEDGFTYHDILESNSTDDINTKIENDKAYEMDVFNLAFKYLNENEKTILIHHFGLNGETPKIDEDIASIVGLKKPNVGMARRNAILKLRIRVKRIMKGEFNPNPEPITKADVVEKMKRMRLERNIEPTPKPTIKVKSKKSIKKRKNGYGRLLDFLFK